MSKHIFSWKNILSIAIEQQNSNVFSFQMAWSFVCLLHFKKELLFDWRKYEKIKCQVWFIKPLIGYLAKENFYISINQNNTFTILLLLIVANLPHFFLFSCLVWWQFHPSPCVHIFPFEIQNYTCQQRRIWCNCDVYNDIVSQFQMVVSWQRHWIVSKDTKVQTSVGWFSFFCDNVWF